MHVVHLEKGGVGGVNVSSSRSNLQLITILSLRRKWGKWAVIQAPRQQGNQNNKNQVIKNSFEFENILSLNIYFIIKTIKILNVLIWSRLDFNRKADRFFSFFERLPQCRTTSPLLLLLPPPPHGVRINSTVLTSSLYGSGQLSQVSFFTPKIPL